MKLTKHDKLKYIKPNFMLTTVYSADDIKRYHRGHFFSPDIMRFFASRLIQDVFPTNKKSVYFVTSEKACFNDLTRVFNVRRYDIEKDSFDTIETLSSRAKALSLALYLAYNESLKSEVIND